MSESPSDSFKFVFLPRVARAAGRRLLLLSAALLLLCGGLRAQNYSWDARNVGMGGATGLGQGNLATGLVPSDRRYTSIPVPLGLFQVLSNLNVFNPDDPEFDTLRAIDYVGNPFHYSFQRSQKTGSIDFLQNIIDSGFNRDLNTYRGFAPPEHMVAGGLLAPNWGYTLKVHRGANDSFQGIYVGAGPYLSLQSDLRFDPQLIAILGSPVNVAVPANTNFFATNNSAQQTAGAITGGYRTKIGFPSSLSARDGVYVAFNFNYLIGVRQDTVGMNLQLDTDNAGLITLTPTSVPLAIDYLYSTSGKGFSTDAGVVVVRNGWEFGVGANGIANRIDWRNHHAKRYTLSSVLTGVDLVTTSVTAPTGTIRKELPVQYAANAGYSAGSWTVRTNWNYGLQKLVALGGAEYRLGPLALRGGARYGVKQWNPTGGVGLNFTRRMGIDVGFFGNSTNLEQRRNVSMAVSLRFDRDVE
jgi:hypothetical protein